MVLQNTKLFLNGLMVLLVLPFSILFSSVPDSLSTEPKQNNYTFTIGYWNDNFPIDNEVNNLFGRDIFQTDDDFITARFWVRVSKQEKYSQWFLDSYLNIATNRRSNFRTDLLSFVLTYETQFKSVLIKIGGGFILGGNFAGSQIQNFYHNLASIDELFLPYSKETYFGLSVHSSIEHIFVKKKAFQIKGISSFFYFTDGGPNSIEFGAESTYAAIKNSLFFNMYAGYKNYFSMMSNFKSLFGEGIVWGFSSTVKISKTLQMSFWGTGNQYGKGSNNHFGISFSFRSQKLIPINFKDISYP